MKALFNSDLPKHFKIAILKNYAFVRDAGLYELTHHGLTQSDVLNLYKEHTQNPDNRLFFELFLNPAIPEEFIERVFKKEGYLQLNESAGFGYDIDWNFVAKYRVNQ